jgi:hypothetical protein
VTDRLVLWDFDGTLAWRPGMWSGCVMEVLDEIEAGHAVTAEQLRNGLRSGFPWHAPNEPHPQLVRLSSLRTCPIRMREVVPFISENMPHLEPRICTL